MNHLLNKDWEYVLHIYKEEMKESTGWGKGEEQAKLMVSYLIVIGVALETYNKLESSLLNRNYKGGR